MKGRSGWPPSALEEWRRRRGMSCRELARRANRSANWISMLENGKARPSGDMRRLLADILKVPAEALFDEDALNDD